MSRFKKFLIVLAGCLVVSGSTALALTATDFYQEAASWSYQNCRTVSETSRLNNTVCFLLKNNSDNQIKWALQNSNNLNQQNSINSKKQVVTYDSNGIKLGPTISENTFLDSDINRTGNMTGDGVIGGGYSKIFESNDCSGTAYLDAGPTFNLRFKLLRDHVGNFLIHPDGAVSQLKNINSILQAAGCDSYVATLNVAEITQIARPYPSTITMPLDYRNE